MSRDIALDDSDSPPAKRQRTEESPGDELGRVSEGSGDGDGEGNHDASDASGSSSGSSSSYSSDSDSSSELDQVVGSELILETRKFLKENGTIKFLEKYLPMTATAEDIIKVIIQLGFLPRNLPSADTPIFELVQILQRAMKSVRSMRTRLHDFTTVEQAVEKIKAANKILVITGAGISTSLGIPDFRSSKGFYAKIEHLGFSDPQEVFDLDLFHADPSVFYSIAHMILPPDKAYTPLHEFIKVLQDKDKLLRNYTQNIDDIESHVGLDRGKVIQCHGSFAFASCVTCGFQVKGEELFPQIRAQEIPYCPRCFKTREKLMNNDESYVPESYGVMKPDITFFGEPLPKRFHQMIREDLTECDLVISAGTSLKVAPVADIVSKIDEKVPQILLNKDPISHCNFDVSLLGYCDDAACYLSKKLGDTWKLTHEHANSVNLTVEQIDAEERLFQVNKL